MDQTNVRRSGVTLCVLCVSVFLAACAPGPVDTEGDGQVPFPEIPATSTDLDPVLAPGAALPTSELPSPEVAVTPPTVGSPVGPSVAQTVLPNGVDEPDSRLGPVPEPVAASSLGAATETAAEASGTTEPETGLEPAIAPASAVEPETVPESTFEPEPASMIELEPESTSESEPEPAVEPEPVPESAPELVVEPTSAPEVEPESVPEPEVTPDAGPEPAPVPDPGPEAVSELEPVPVAETEPTAEAPSGNPFDVVDEPELGAGSDRESSEAGESDPEAIDPVDEEPGDELPTHDPNGIPYCD